MNTCSRSPRTPPNKQRGLITILVTVAFLLILAFAALAIDVNHMVLNKAKLQNVVDAAALAAVEQAFLTPGSDADKTGAAQTAVTNLFTEYEKSAGNTSFNLPKTHGTVDDKLSILFANNNLVFNSVSIVNANQIFVRVQVTNYVLDSYFISLFGIDKVVNASAVAGLVPTYTSILPITACVIDETDTGFDPDNGDNSIYGFVEGKAYALKMQESGVEMAPGNFQLLDAGSGASAIAEGLASNCESCIVPNGDFISSEPGNSVGPVGSGLNTRFGDYDGSMGKYEGVPGYEADDNTDEITQHYDMTYFDDPSVEYKESVKIYEKGDTEEIDIINFHDKVYNTSPDPETNKRNYRRMVTVPIIECPAGAKGGKGSYKKVNDLCFLLLNRAPTSASDKTPVIGEFRDECLATSGTLSEDGDLTGPMRAVLIKDPYNEDS